MKDIALPLGAEDFLKRRLEDDDYEKDQLELVEKYVLPHHRVLEGGAGLGIVTKALTERAEFVISCEVSTELMKCAAHNAPQAIVMHYCLGYDSRTAPHTGEAFGVEPVRMARMMAPDALIYTHSLNALVLDVEGKEGEILERVDLDPLELIIVEWHTQRESPRRLREAAERMLDFGLVEQEVILDHPLEHAVYARD